MTADVHIKMLEIKKRIQLSEGRRKAAFEECDLEKKATEEEIISLKKQISELLEENYKVQHNARTFFNDLEKLLESMIGPVAEKDVDNILQLVNLQIVDKEKNLDLLRYKIRKRLMFLNNLGKEYQNLLSKRALNEVTDKVDKPAKKVTCDLQNSIHSVQVQFREAKHIMLLYKDIKYSLQKDSATFESNIKNLEEKLATQRNDIRKLEGVMSEALKMCETARGYLLKEERHTLSSSNLRERQKIEGKQLVVRRKQDLENLEKQVFQCGKSLVRTEEIADDGGQGTDDETPQTPPRPLASILSEAFDVLKKATGATSTEEVAGCFSEQRNTNIRLLALRKNYEVEKRQLEHQVDTLQGQLEHFKYADGKETERGSFQVEKVQERIHKVKTMSADFVQARQTKEKSIRTILTSIKDLCSCLNPTAIIASDNSTIAHLFSNIETGLKNIQFEARSEAKKDDLADEIGQNVIVVSDTEAVVIEDKWLPIPYSGLVRETPLPQSTGPSPAPVQPSGSEDEMEVPSRTYLKKQGQLVVDAKSRRKNIRLHQLKK